MNSPLGRVHGAYRATAIAEYFRDRGQHVLLLMDSLTRFAMAQREIGLAVGEMPATRGYPASVFGRIAVAVRARRQRRDRPRQHHRLLHRAGRGRRSQRSGRRLGALDPRRASRAVAQARRSRALPGARRRRLGQPRDAGGRPARATRARAALQAALQPARGKPRHDRDRRLSAGQRCRARPGGAAAAGDERIPAPGHDRRGPLRGKRGGARARSSVCKGDSVRGTWQD